MAHATVIKLPGSSYPWAYALHIHKAESDVFHAFIEALKLCIPSRSRKWDSSAKRWLFKAEAGDALIALLQMHNLNYEVVDEAPAHWQLMSISEAAATLHLLPTAPKYIVDCVYKAMAKKLHPDAGGSTEQMQRINCAIEILREQGAEA